MEHDIEKMGNVIYKTLKTDSITHRMGNRAYIADILSQALCEAGYRLPCTDKREAVDNLIGEALSEIGCEFNCIKAERNALDVKERLTDQILSLLSPELKECYITCSRCGSKVSNTVLSSLPECIVVRAFVECADCVAKQPEPVEMTDAEWELTRWQLICQAQLKAIVGE